MKKRVTIYFDRKPYFTLNNAEIEHPEKNEFVKILKKWGFGWKFDENNPGIQSDPTDAEYKRYMHVCVTPYSISAKLDIDDVFKLQKDFGSITIDDDGKKRIMLD